MLCCLSYYVVDSMDFAKSSDEKPQLCGFDCYNIRYDIRPPPPPQAVVGTETAQAVAGYQAKQWGAHGQTLEGPSSALGEPGHPQRDIKLRPWTEAQFEREAPSDMEAQVASCLVPLL